MKMKKLVLVLLAAALVGMFAACSKNAGETLTTVRLSEVTRSVFYAPMYAAIQLGFFEDEGIYIDLMTSDGADRVMTALLSGAADIGLSGPEAAIYVWAGGREDFPVVFAKLTQRDGSFLIGRQPMPGFTWEDIRGSHVLPGRRGGMPFMVLEYVARSHGLTPDVDVVFDNTIQFAAMVGAFLGGTADFVTAFEPVASTIVLEGRGYVVASVGEAFGEIPYTAFYALGSFLEKEPALVQGFTNGLYRGQQWVQANTPADIAGVIAPFFPEADMNVLTRAIGRYKEIEAYATAPHITRAGFDNLQQVMAAAGELPAYVPFEVLVDNGFADGAVGR